MMSTSRKRSTVVKRSSLKRMKRRPRITRTACTAGMTLRTELRRPPASMEILPSASAAQEISPSAESTPSRMAQLPDLEETVKLPPGPEPEEILTSGNLAGILTAVSPRL